MPYNTCKECRHNVVAIFFIRKITIIQQDLPVVQEVKHWHSDLASLGLNNFFFFRRVGGGRCVVLIFLAHQIRISACFTCTYKSYLTHVISPRTG